MMTTSGYWMESVFSMIKVMCCGFSNRNGIEATNNRAERDLRPAVIARKVSHCSRNETGARAFEAFTSVIQTLRKIDPAGIVTELVKLIGNPPAIASP